MNTIASWTPQQLRDFVKQVARDNPPQQGSVSHDTVNVGQSLTVNGQQVVGPNAFPYQFSATSGRGVRQGAFADTMSTTARANAIYKGQSPAYQFYQSFERVFANSSLSYNAGYVAANGGVPVGSSVYIPVDCTLQAAGFFLARSSTYPLTAQSCAIYGPWDTGPLINGAYSPPLVTQTVNRAVDVIGNAQIGIPYSWMLNLAEFSLPNIFLRAGVYYVFLSFGGTATGNSPNILGWDPVAAGSGGVNANAQGSFFGEPYPTLLGSNPLNFSTTGWPSTILGMTGLAPGGPMLWSYIKTS